MKLRSGPPIPDEHLDPTITMPLRPHPPSRLNGNLQDRTSPDPFFQIFRGAQGEPVISIDEARAVAHHNGRRLPRAYAGSAPRVADFLRSPRRNSVLNLLGALASYRALTNGQAATITGDVAYADPRSPVVADLFRSGLIHLSPAHLEHGLGSVGHGAAVYQLGDLKVVRELHDHLSFPEWLALTGNRPLPTSRVNVRHDVLGTELALRASRLREVGAVLGPHFSTFRDPHSPLPRRARNDGGPDLIVVTDTGLRIAVEITATIGQRFQRKVEHWTKWLEENPFERCGVTVVFVAASSIENRRRRGDWARADIFRALGKATRQFPGSVRDPVSARIGVASWGEWFPEAWLASERFSQFTVDQPTGRGGSWEPRDLLAQTPPWRDRTSSRPRRMIRDASMLSQTPPWLRTPHRPLELAADLLREVAGPPPAVAPHRHDAATRTPGVGQGATADSLLPRRLLGPTDDVITEHLRITAPPRSPTDWPTPRPAIRPRRHGTGTGGAA